MSAASLLYDLFTRSKDSEVGDFRSLLFAMASFAARDVYRRAGLEAAPMRMTIQDRGQAKAFEYIVSSIEPLLVEILHKHFGDEVDENKYLQEFRTATLMLVAAARGVNVITGFEPAAGSTPAAKAVAADPGSIEDLLRALGDGMDDELPEEEVP